MWGSAARGAAGPAAAEQLGRGPASAPPAGPDATSFINGSSNYVPFPDVESASSPQAAASSSAAPTAPARASSGLARGSGGGLEESPAWSHYLRGTQGVLALVVVVLTASQPEGGAGGGGGGTGWRALPPFRYLLAVAVMTLAATLGCGVLQCLNAARRMSLPVGTVFDSVWCLLCATAGISAAAALGLRGPLRLGCAAVSGEGNDCAQLKAATGLMFGLALLSALSLAYEAALWRAVAAEAATAGAAGVPSSAPLPYGSTGTRYVGAGGSSGGRRRLNVLYASGMAGLLGPSGLLRRAVEYVTYPSATSGLPEPLVPPEGVPGASGGGAASRPAASAFPTPAAPEDWSDVDLAADTARRAASKLASSRTAGAAAAVKAALGRARGRSSSSTSAVAALAPGYGQAPLPVSHSAGAALSGAGQDAQGPGGSDSAAATAATAPPSSTMQGSGRVGALSAAASLTSRYRVKEAPWLAQWMMGLRLLQVTLTAACLGALTGGGRVHLPGGGYSSTTAYRLLVAAAALGLATAAVLGVWQALRALSFDFYRFARRGTRAYLYSCAVADTVLWLLVASAATAAAAVSTLPCAVVVATAPAGGGPRVAVFSRVHAGCVPRDRAAAALGLLAAPVWLAAALLSAAVAHEAAAKRARLRRQRAYKREAEVLMTTTTRYTGGGGGGDGATDASIEGAAGWPAGVQDVAEAEEAYAGMAARAHSGSSRGWWGTGVATGRTGPLSRGLWGSSPASPAQEPGAVAGASGTGGPPATGRRGSGLSSSSASGSKAADPDNPYATPHCTHAVPNPFGDDPWVVEDSLPGAGALYGVRRAVRGRGGAPEGPHSGGQPPAGSSGGVEPVLDVRQERGDIHMPPRGGGPTAPLFTLE
ncbi:hypothetical protein CHLRE_09g387650v5 [Chlamydomonas reinhardtii]|uniref:Uncharacterized protein n=1 Tax=Chlamydomonas reinhardtii TaxID=3055 RepID=A0A2K3DDS2_CHLRE|nr:uncharacterized protein CHLRE_09g387650v5 [Chlamydomonas reinhardtii]PNW78667.1 hypothetical protein CHLRE_09g387650v5 [Chlamydomonas reinhardtii]